MGPWVINVTHSELALTTALSGKPIMTLNGSAINYVFISDRTESPVSLKTVKKKMKQLQGRALKVHKLKGGEVFSFTEGNRVHWFSTDDRAYLLAEMVETNTSLTNKNYQALLRRVRKGFK